jgi:hypothetical protein
LGCSSYRRQKLPSRGSKLHGMLPLSGLVSFDL